MRLLEYGAHGDLCLTKNLIEAIPSYAILSHTWGVDGDEVHFNDIRDGTGKDKIGYAKLQFCGEQARKDGLSYFWVDTCCIDQTNQVELNEAIVSMFRWYRNAVTCYVYLTDVTTSKRGADGQAEIPWQSAFYNSRWFTRGWTLQELLAPKQVEFYARDRKLLGDRTTLQEEIHNITQIPNAAICGANLSEYPNEERMRWASKRNTKRPEDKWYCLLGIFDVFMLPMYGEGDFALVRLKDEIAKSCRRQLETFGLPSILEPVDGSFNRAQSDPHVSPVVPVLTNRKDLLASLSFEQMDARRSTIKNAYSTTCRWFLNHVAYTNWINSSKFSENCGLLWINGKPGAGKSTLVKFAHANASKNRLTGEILVSFFFNARGDELEKSTIGMYRALLYQLLIAAPDLQDLLDETCLLSTDGDHNKYPAWTLDSLSELFSAAVMRLGQRKLRCFIDALDECGENEIRNMVAFLEELGESALEQGTQLYICFASRHYPAIDIRYGLKLILEDENGHSEDLAKYVRSRLRAGEGKYIQDIRSLLLEKANGIFMWAVLVVNILNKEFLNGSIFSVKKRLDEIPAELGDVFREILRRDSDNMDRLLLCLQWILFAKQPLKREEFYFAMVAGLESEAETIAEWDPEHTTVAAMTRFVLSSSKGLAELTRSRSPTVQFIHESVRDFLIKEKGLVKLWSELESDMIALSHDRLKQCCSNYLKINLEDHVSSNETFAKASSDEAKVARERLTASFPFLGYASRYVLCHADEAAASLPQDGFLKGFEVQSWIKIHNLLERFDIRRHTLNASLIYLLAECGCARLIKIQRQHSPALHKRGERYFYPLFAALANEHRMAVRALLQSDEKLSMDDVTTRLEFGRDFSLPGKRTPLEWAIGRCDEALVEILVISGNAGPNPLDCVQGSMLCLAISNGLSNVVKFLLNLYKFQLDSRLGRTQETLLIHAARQGGVNVVQTLLDCGAYVDLADEIGMTALMHAAHRGDGESTPEIVQLLLNRGAKIDAQNASGTTSLILATGMKNTTLVRTLVEHGANVDLARPDGMTALMIAAKRRCSEIARLLLYKSAAIDLRDHTGRTSLSYAAEFGTKDIVQDLITKKADVNIGDSRGRTPLWWAFACNGHGSTPPFLRPGNHALQDYQMQLMLLELQNKKRLMMARQQEQHFPGASYDAYFRIDWQGTSDIVQLLLDEGADINKQDAYGRTILMWMAYAGLLSALTILLDSGADMDIEDSAGRTALDWARSAGSMLAAELLITRGADTRSPETSLVDINDFQGEMAASKVEVHNSNTARGASSEQQL